MQITVLVIFSYLHFLQRNTLYIFCNYLTQNFEWTISIKKVSKPEYLKKKLDESKSWHTRDILEVKIHRPNWGSNLHPLMLVILSWLELAGCDQLSLWLPLTSKQGKCTISAVTR